MNDKQNQLTTENTSGIGENAEVPEEIKRWNWGAFFFTVFWAMNNGVPVSFSNFINPFYAFEIAANGNEKSWKLKHWDSIKYFKTVQRRWALAPLMFFIGMFVLILPPVFICSGNLTPLKMQALEIVINNPDVNKRLGTPIQIVDYNHSYTHMVHRDGKDMGSNLMFPVKGPQGSADINLFVNRDNQRITYLEITFKNGEQLILIK